MNIDDQIKYIELELVVFRDNCKSNSMWDRDVKLGEAILKTLKEFKEADEYADSLIREKSR